MAGKNKIWNDTCERFVAFLDIMGFKERVFQETSHDIRSMFERIRQTIKSIERQPHEIKVKKNNETTWNRVYCSPIVKGLKWE